MSQTPVQGGRDSSLLFVVGMPRSGTKLLRDLLNRHPAVALFPHETHFIPYFERRFATYGDVSKRPSFAQFHADFEGTTFAQRMEARGIRFDQSAWFERLSGSAYSDVLGALFQLYRDLTGCPVVGDKTPDYVTQVPLLQSLFPAAMLVHIVRDPRDYVLSMRKAWGKSVPRSAQRWKEQIRKYRADVARLGIDHREVSYEELITRPRRTLQVLCDYLRVPFDDAMLSLQVTAENLGDARGATSILGDNLGKWKLGLSAREVDRIEAIAGQLMQESGYVSEGHAADRDVGALEMSLCAVSDGLNLLRFNVADQGGLLAAVRQMLRARRFSGVDR